MCVLEAQKLTDMHESKLQTIISLKEDDVHGLTLVRGEISSKIWEGRPSNPLHTILTQSATQGVYNLIFPPKSDRNAAAKRCLKAQSLSNFCGCKIAVIRLFGI